jgi:DNA-binding MarR family transcriptional regulator
MSTLVQRLGVSLSTVSGLVDKVVDHGLATRREDPADRRQVLVGLTPEGAAFIDRFRELNARQMRELLEALEDDELAQVRDALGHLARAATRILPSPTAPTSARGVRVAVTRKDLA